MRDHAGFVALHEHPVALDIRGGVVSFLQGLPGDGGGRAQAHGADATVDHELAVQIVRLRPFADPRRAVVAGLVAGDILAVARVRGLAEADEVHRPVGRQPGPQDGSTGEDRGPVDVGTIEVGLVDIATLAHRIEGDAKRGPVRLQRKIRDQADIAAGVAVFGQRTAQPARGKRAAQVGAVGHQPDDAA